MSELQQVVERGQFVITSEIGPPKGVDCSHALEEAATYFKGRAHAVNVTDNQSSVMRLGSMVVCHLLADRGLEPVFQMTCRDRNRLALQSDLLSAAALGIENVLALTGDHNRLGDHPGSMPVFDLDSITLLQAIGDLENGRDLSGAELEGDPPKFFPGAVVNPGAEPFEPELIKAEKKVACGARFFQTQGVFEPERFVAVMEQLRPLGVPVLAGIILLKSAGMAKYMNANVAGVSVPDHLIKRMADAGAADKAAKAEGKKGGHAVATSIEIAGELISALKPHCQGVHIMPLGWDKHVPPVLDAAGLNGGG